MPTEFRIFTPSSLLRQKRKEDKKEGKTTLEIFVSGPGISKTVLVATAAKAFIRSLLQTYFTNLSILILSISFDKKEELVHFNPVTKRSAGFSDSRSVQNNPETFMLLLTDLCRLTWKARMLN